VIGYYLGTACANVIFTMSAQKIVIGGGVMNRELLYDRIRHHCFKTLNNYINHPRLKTEENLKSFIVKSKYEHDLGLIASAMIGAYGQKA
jgi:fructokinase